MNADQVFENWSDDLRKRAMMSIRIVTMMN